ncbi:M28 family peptidase [bacterium]|nr:M28 family peptidase [bacterium]
MNNNFEKILAHLVNEIGERPVGSSGNHASLALLERQFVKLGYNLKNLDFDCYCWEYGESSIKTTQRNHPIHPGGFSNFFEGTCPIELIETVDQLESANLENKIAVLNGTISNEPLMPKDFPFYYPEEHQRIINALESKNPSAIVAVTGKHPFCGLNPFPLFDDGNFNIPNACMDQNSANKINYSENKLTLTINSRRIPGKSRQLVASTRDSCPRKIVICGHMDTAYNTPGALDNATGLIVMLKLAARISSYSGDYKLEFVPFNGEEYYGVSGQLAYLADQEQKAESIALVINIDSPGHTNSKTALSFYNFNPSDKKKVQKVMDSHQICETGSQWIAGDHSIFAFRNIPCIAVTSSDLESEIMGFSHTPRDTINHVDPAILEETAIFLEDYITSF